MKALKVWDYAASVQKMRPLVVRWKTLTSEMLEELHQAREALSKQGARTDLDPNGSKSWIGYLRDIGLAKETARRWLGFYDPVEKKKIEPPPKPQPEPIRPKGRTIDDEEYERRKEEVFEEEEGPSLDEVFEDVQKVLVRQEDEEVFREFDLAALIQELRRRILGIADPTRRHHAINQIIKAMKELAIECDREAYRRP